MHRHLVAVLTAALLCVGGSWARAPLPSPPAVSDRGELTPPDSQKTRRLPGAPRLKISLWYGHSTRPGYLLGTISDNRLRLLGLRIHRRLLPTSVQQTAGHTPTLTYTADLIPFASIQIPQEAVPDYYVEGLQRHPLSTSGVGMYPIGLKVAFRPTTRLRPFAAGHTGVLYFFEPVPDTRGKQLNFAAGIGGGVEVSITPHTLLTLAYRYHHLSNGFRGSINPGLDANLLYLGVGVSL